MKTAPIRGLFRLSKNLLVREHPKRFPRGEAVIGRLQRAVQ